MPLTPLKDFPDRFSGVHGGLRVTYAPPSAGDRQHGWVVVKLVPMTQGIALASAFSGPSPAHEDDALKAKQISKQIEASIVSFRHDDYGGLRVIGRVKNDSPVPVKSVKVILTYLDAQKRVFEQATEYVDDGNVISPGETGNFQDFRADPKRIIDTVETKVLLDQYGVIAP
jgi:hypothetical protein